MATVKKTINQLSAAKPNTLTKKIASKNLVANKKAAVKSLKKVASKKSTKKKELTRAEYLKLVYPHTLTNQEKLEKVLQSIEFEVYDLVRKKLLEAFTTHDYEFESLIEWLTSGSGKEFLEENDLFSGMVVDQVLEHAKGQFETDSWNEDSSSLTKTAGYVFEVDYSIIPDEWSEHFKFAQFHRRSR